MATSGKKSKKQKWKKHPALNLIINNSLPVPRKTGNWADDPELDQIGTHHDYGRKVDNFTLPTEPRSARGQDDDAKIPHEPPFVAVLTNIPYEVNEEELANYFETKLNVKLRNVTLPREERNNRFRGFGYVEFEDRASFVNVMNVASDLTIRTRRIRIEVHDGKSDSGRGGRGGMRSGGNNPEPEHINRDWRQSGPPTDKDDDSFRSGRRDNDRGGYGRRDDRRGGFGERDRGGGGASSGYRSFSRDDNRDWSRDGDRDQGSWRDDRDRGGYGRSNYDDRRNESGSWRRNRDDFDRRSPERSEPKSRPKITLQPRTIPLEESKESDTSAAIFGGAKPVNTAAREREIEERLARQSAAVDDAPRRRGPSSQDSWDSRDRDRDRGGDRDRDRGDRDQDRDRGRDKGRADDYEDYDRKCESDNKDIDVDKERVSSQEGESRRDDEPPRKLEPAPPPKENPWTRRQQNSSNTVNNGRVSPSEVENQPLSRGTSPRPPTKEDSSSGDGSVRKYQPPRGQLSELKRGDRKPLHDDHNKGSAGSGRGGSSSAPAKAGPQGAARSKDQKKDERDEKLRIPKYEEQKAPNFAGSNKYAFLDEANETAAN